MSIQTKPASIEVGPALLSIDASAVYLGGLSPWTVRRKVYAGEITGVRCGGRLMIERQELDRYICDNRTQDPLGRRART